MGLFDSIGNTLGTALGGITGQNRVLDLAGQIRDESEFSPFNITGSPFGNVTFNNGALNLQTNPFLTGTATDLINVGLPSLFNSAQVPNIQLPVANPSNAFSFLPPELLSSALTPGFNQQQIGSAGNTGFSLFNQSALNAAQALGNTGLSTIGAGLFSQAPQTLNRFSGLSDQALAAGLSGQQFLNPLASAAGTQAGSLFGASQNALNELSSFNPNLASSDALQLLRSQAQPFEERAFSSLQDRLFSRGQLGTTGGGLQTEAFARGLGQADLDRQLQAIGLGQQLQSNLVNQASQLNQAGVGTSGLSGNLFNIGNQNLLQGISGSGSLFGQGVSSSLAQQQGGAGLFGLQSQLQSDAINRTGLAQSLLLNPSSLSQSEAGRLFSNLSTSTGLGQQAIGQNFGQRLANANLALQSNASQFSNASQLLNAGVGLFGNISNQLSALGGLGGNLGSGQSSANLAAAGPLFTSEQNLSDSISGLLFGGLSAGLTGFGKTRIGG